MRVARGVIPLTPFFDRFDIVFQAYLTIFLSLYKLLLISFT